ERTGDIGPYFNFHVIFSFFNTLFCFTITCEDMKKNFPDYTLGKHGLKYGTMKREPLNAEGASQAMKKKIIIISSSFIALLGLAILFFPGVLTIFKENASQDVREQPKDLRMDGYAEMQEKVDVDSEIAFSSEKENLTMDIYTPKESKEEKKSVIFLAHGGAFIAGDKKSFADYSVMLASEGYEAVNINYGLAPAYTYPSSLEDIREAYEYARKHQTDYEMDFDRIACGGASAGGQIMGQFVNIQVDEQYSEKVDIDPVVDADSIKAIFFFSAL